MDLTHEQFVHGSSIGHDSLSESDFEVTHTDHTVTVTKWMLGIDPPPFWKRNLADRYPDYDGPVDRWQIIRYTAPGTVASTSGWPRPAPARRRATAARASAAGAQHHDPGDREQLPLPVGVRPGLVPGQAGDHHPAAGGRVRGVLRGRGDAGGPAAGHRGQPGLRVLQPEHRRRHHVDPADRAAHGRRRTGHGRRQRGRGRRRSPGRARRRPAWAPRATSAGGPARSSRSATPPSTSGRSCSNRSGSTAPPRRARTSTSGCTSTAGPTCAPTRWSAPARPATEIILGRAAGPGQPRRIAASCTRCSPASR